MGVYWGLLLYAVIVINTVPELNGLHKTFVLKIPVGKIFQNCAHDNLLKMIHCLKIWKYVNVDPAWLYSHTFPSPVNAENVLGWGFFPSCMINSQNSSLFNVVCTFAVKCNFHFAKRLAA